MKLEISWYISDSDPEVSVSEDTTVQLSRVAIYTKTLDVQDKTEALNKVEEVKKELKKSDKPIYEFYWNIIGIDCL